jgi:hypothetical protein
MQYESKDKIQKDPNYITEILGGKNLKKNTVVTTFKKRDLVNPNKKKRKMNGSKINY